MLPLDLHVLSLSLAFILSQDQTLHCHICVDLFSVFLLRVSESRMFFHPSLDLSGSTFRLCYTLSVPSDSLYEECPQGVLREKKGLTLFEAHSQRKKFFPFLFSKNFSCTTLLFYCMNYVNDRLLPTAPLLDSPSARPPERPPAKRGQWCKSNTFLFPDQISRPKVFCRTAIHHGEDPETRRMQSRCSDPAGRLQKTGDRFCGHKSTPFLFSDKPFENFFSPNRFGDYPTKTTI